MFVRKTPFGKIKRRLIPVFPHTAGGMVYLVSTGYPDPNIYPEEVQEAERNVGIVQYLLNKAAIRLSDKLGITAIEAKRQFAPQLRQYKYEDYLNEEEFSHLQDLLNTGARNLANKVKLSLDEANLKLGNPIQSNTEIVHDYTMYLDEAEMTKLFDNLNSGKQGEAIEEAVTLTMRHRLAHTVPCFDSPLDGAIRIESWFDIFGGEKVKFGNQSGIVDKYDSYEDAVYLKGFGMQSPASETMVFLKDNGDYRYGWENWSKEDTLALKAIPCNSNNGTAFDAVYEFFQAEISGTSRSLKSDIDDVDMGEYSKNSLTTSTQHQLNGGTSTTELLAVT